MHDCGFVHQDLKSSNVLIFGDRTVKVCDFGLARKKPDTMMLVDRELCTLWYRAPELLMCESMYTHKIDEWSVGCMMLEMVIGSPPFRGKPECTCQCPQVTHRNFNSDQLARIFLVTGMHDTALYVPHFPFHSSFSDALHFPPQHLHARSRCPCTQ